MSKKQLTLALAGICTALAAQAEITVRVENAPGKTLEIRQSPATPEAEPPAPFTVTLDAEGTAVFSQAPMPVSIAMYAGDGQVGPAILSAGAEERIQVSIDSEGKAVCSGTPLMEGVTRVDGLVAPFTDRFRQLAQGYEADPEGTTRAMEALEAEVDAALRKYLTDHASAPEAAYALLMLDGQSFLDMYGQLAPETRQSMLMPQVERKHAGELRRVEAERRMAELENGVTPAPAFTLPDLAGNRVSLSDFAGKWVVIDFWGSWCRWCVKGFPELKELAARYGDELAIVGVDCRDSDERWRAAVEKYGLTWVNLYNDCSGESNPLLEAYAVQGFPTKVIVDPRGIVRKIVVGADPSFPDTLAGLMGK